jgi:hypothetical protein
MTTTAENWTKISPYDRFSYFIAMKVDRYKTLLQTIEKLSLNSLVITIEKNKHIFIFPPSRRLPRPIGSALPFAGESPFMFVAHYDRVEGSPGANDNSIAVFHLLRAAMILAKENIDNWMLVFTDKEELVSGESFESQGSFTLAQKLKAWGLDKAKVFNFDACGTGDTFIFSNIAASVLQNKAGANANIQKVSQDITRLRDHGLKTISKLHYDKILLAPTPFGDDMGFLRAGFAAQTITVLPSEEAKKFEEVLRKYPEFTNQLISGGVKNQAVRPHLPMTWKNINGPADMVGRLTPEHFDRFVQFVVGLCK